MANSWMVPQSQARSAGRIESRYFAQNRVGGWRNEEANQEAQAREVLLHRMLFQTPLWLSRT
jgi:hypothetical protein